MFRPGTTSHCWDADPTDKHHQRRAERAWSLFVPCSRTWNSLRGAEANLIISGHRLYTFRSKSALFQSKKALQADLVQGASQRRQSVEKEQVSGCHILARGDTYARLGAGKDNRGPSDRGRLVIRKTPCPARKIVSGVREHKIVDQRDQGRAVIRGSHPGAEKPCRARNR